MFYSIAFLARIYTRDLVNPWQLTTQISKKEKRIQFRNQKNITQQQNTGYPQWKRERTITITITRVLVTHTGLATTASVMQSPPILSPHTHACSQTVTTYRIYPHKGRRVPGDISLWAPGRPAGLLLYHFKLFRGLQPVDYPSCSRWTCRRGPCFQRWSAGGLEIELAGQCRRSKVGWGEPQLCL